MSLHVPDFHASERTFQLLTQAVGRAGRGKEPGQAVIQTYDPDHFAIQTAKEQDYDAFYKQEIAYRRMLAYPPVWQLLLIHCTGTDPAGDDSCSQGSGRISASRDITERQKYYAGRTGRCHPLQKSVMFTERSFT